MNQPPPIPAAAARPFERAAALLEVIAAFAVVHVCFRAFKRFTDLGQAEVAAGLNFSPGAIMTLFTLLALLLCGRSFAAYGLAVKDWRYDLGLGLAWSAWFIVIAGWFDRVIGPYFDGEDAAAIARAGVLTGVELVNTIALAWFLMRERSLIRRIHPVAVMLCLAGLLLALAFTAIHRERSVAYVLVSVAWLFFGAGCGEEIFFRGYVQSRVDLAFGKPLRLLGVDFGWGLIVSALLFGFIHVLLPTDYFAERFDFAWWKLPQYFASGLFFGVLREKTGSVLAGALIHGLTDVAGKVPELLET